MAEEYDLLKAKYESSMATIGVLEAQLAEMARYVMLASTYLSESGFTPDNIREPLAKMMSSAVLNARQATAQTKKISATPVAPKPAVTTPVYVPQTYVPQPYVPQQIYAPQTYAPRQESSSALSITDPAVAEIVIKQLIEREGKTAANMSLSVAIRALATNTANKTQKNKVAELFKQQEFSVDGKTIMYNP